MLKTETNTPEMRRRIEDAFCVSDAATCLLKDETWEAAFEHGQWWVIANTGASWSVVDAIGAGTIDGFDFEQL